MPGFLEVLEKVVAFYSEQGGDARDAGRKVAAAIKSEEVQQPGEVRSAVVSAAFHQMIGEADAVNGGFGHAPKFPHAAAIEFMMAQHSRGMKEAVAVVVNTLDRMQAGGIYDQVGGGFHRYSTDHEWIVPHFEKMSYDNAGLLRNYVHGYQLFKDEEYRKTADGISRFFLETLSGDPGFFASQDADAFPGDDGDFWTWTPKELSEAVSGKERDAISLYFHIRGVAEMHGRRDKHVLYRAMSVEEVAANISAGRAETARLVSVALKSMLEARSRRPVPHVDRTVYSNWNGMAISSLYEYARTFLNDTVVSKCRKAVDSALSSSYEDGFGFNHVIGGGGSIRGLLEDQVHMGHALLDAFCYHGCAEYIEAAKSIAELINRNYSLPYGCLNDVDRRINSVDKTGLTSVDNVPLFDSPNASPNACASMFFQRIASLTGESKFDDFSDRILKYAVQKCLGSGAYAGAMFQAMDIQINGIPQIVVTGDASDINFQELLRAAGMIYLPGKEVVRVDTSSSAVLPYSETVSAMIRRSASSGKAFAFLCRGRSCSPPAESAADLVANLN
jgi:hypothetical protein